MKSGDNTINKNTGGIIIDRFKIKRKELLLLYGKMALENNLITQDEFDKILEQINIKYA